MSSLIWMPSIKYWSRFRLPPSDQKRGQGSFQIGIHFSARGTSRSSRSSDNIDWSNTMDETALRRLSLVGSSDLRTIVPGKKVVRELRRDIAATHASVLSENSIRAGSRIATQNHPMIRADARAPALARNV